MAVQSPAEREAEAEAAGCERRAWGRGLRAVEDVDDMETEALFDLLNGSNSSSSSALSSADASGHSVVASRATDAAAVDAFSGHGIFAAIVVSDSAAAAAAAAAGSKKMNRISNKSSRSSSSSSSNSSSSKQRRMTK